MRDNTTRKPRVGEIVLFGDSYTAGRIPHTHEDGAFATALGVPPEYDHAVSGSTAQQWAADANGMLSAVVESDAEIAVGSLGGNDMFAALADGVATSDEIIEALAALFHVLMRLAGKARVIVMLYPDPFFGARADVAAGHQKLIAAIRALTGLAHSITSNIIVFDLSRVLRPEHFDGVDIHPSREGYQAMADEVRRLVQALRS